MSLEALERGDLTRLPGGIFTRSFVRAYAQEVGLDPDRTIQEFIAELPPEAATATAHHPVVEDGEKLESDRRAVATAFRLLLISVPIIGMVIYLGTPRALLTESSVEPESPADAIVAEPEAVAVEPAVVPAAARAPEEFSGMTLVIAPRGACWVSVTVDDDRAFSRLMAAGERQVVTAKDQILLNVGDAGAFAYTLNGSPGKPLGAPGKVVSARITPATLGAFLTR
jgi:cytoskeletal protein RodZ